MWFFETRVTHLLGRKYHFFFLILELKENKKIVIKKKKKHLGELRGGVFTPIP